MLKLAEDFELLLKSTHGTRVRESRAAHDFAGKFLICAWYSNGDDD
jgi:hypothetical protein